MLPSGHPTSIAMSNPTIAPVATYTQSFYSYVKTQKWAKKWRY